MIIEGFEIENWSCIKSAVVRDLPPTGVVVLHGPNGTGKSSIVAALRACLMDYQVGTSHAKLERWKPKNATEPPRIRVGFRVANDSYRITKQFKKNGLCVLESRTPSGDWKVEAQGSDAHDRTQDLVGGKSSEKGLHQLLWLPQAKIDLPEGGFESDLESRFRTVLGVLQTDVDNAVQKRIQSAWSKWFTAKSMPGDAPTLQKNANLARNTAALAEARRRLEELDREYSQDADKLQAAANLEVTIRLREVERIERLTAFDDLQLEYERAARKFSTLDRAKEVLALAEKSLAEAKEKRGEREAESERVAAAETAATEAGKVHEKVGKELQSALEDLAAAAAELAELRTAERNLLADVERADDRSKLIDLRNQSKSVQRAIEVAEAKLAELAALKADAAKIAVPSEEAVKSLDRNRVQAAKSRSALEASAIALEIVLESGAEKPSVALDERPPEELSGSLSVRRRASLAISGWGRIELKRGSDARALDEIETELRNLDRTFANELAPFGIAADDGALQSLRERIADQRIRTIEIAAADAALSNVAPRGIDALRAEFARLENHIEALLLKGVVEGDKSDDLEDLKRAKSKNAKSIEAVAARIAELEKRIDGPPANAKGKSSATRSGGLRAAASAAGLAFAEAQVNAKILNEHLLKLPSADERDAAIRTATSHLERARQDLADSSLSPSESTVRERRDSAKEALEIFDLGLVEERRKFGELTGELRKSEGLSERRASAAVRVEELERAVDREQLESGSYDRLYQLFEECRVKQLGAVMTPIHDRVFRWMGQLGIAQYEGLNFGDRFLPESMTVRGGASSLNVREESVGTIEQIALLVRLALGATLSSPGDPVAAILDDPLTHSDEVRLRNIRSVLKAAAEGDSNSPLKSGPLQLLIFTCHAEWFRTLSGTSIDLGNEAILSKSR